MATKKRPATTTKRSRATNAGGTDLSGAIDLLLSVPEIAESFSRADIELAIDDRGWVQTSNFTGGNDLDQISRRTMVRRSRMYWQRDPLAKQAVRLWTDYAFGRGLTWKAADEAQQTTLNKVWKARRNRALFSQRGQVKTSKKLLIDGDLYVAIFGEGEDRSFRRMDAMQIEDHICDPDDAEKVLAFRRLLPDGKTSLFYAAWDADDDDKKLAEQQRVGPTRQKVVLQKDVVVYHLPFDDIGERGNGLLTSCLDWSREHRRFQESRVSLTQALAKFAHKITAKGGQKVLDDLSKRMASTFATSGATTQERNPKPAAGSTFFQNSGIEMEQMPRGTGAGDARADANNLKLMVAAGTGIMLHYFGDPENGNLATATAMELPMLKQFGSYQQLIQDFYRDLASITLDEDPDEMSDEIDIDLPPILEADLAALGQAIASFTTVFPELKTDVIIERILAALEINNIDDVMKKVLENRKKIDDQQKADMKAQALAAKNGMVVKPGTTMAKESADELTAAVTQLAEALQR